MILDKESEKKKRVEILCHIADFCELNQIKYSLAFGTLLGAIREKGMIEWDYDIDVMMPRPEYEKFLAVYLAKNRNANYRLKDFTLDSDFLCKIAIVEDMTTCNCTNPFLSDNDPLKRVAVEVYPVDGTADTWEEHEKHIKKLEFLGTCLKAKQAKYDKNRPIYKNVAIFALKIPLSVISSKKILMLIGKESKKYSFEECKNAAVTCIGKIALRTFHDKNLYKEYILADYENRQYCVPKEYDKFLSCMYGNYMSRPSEKAIQHSLKLKNFYNYSVVSSRL